MYSKILIVALIAAIIENCLACNGYKAKLVRYENCAGPDQVVTIEDGFKIKLNKKCELVPEGCVAHKKFETAMGNIHVSKDGVKLKDGEVNVCEAVTNVNAEQRNWLSLFSVPENCPVEEGRLCTTGQVVNLSKYKNMFSFVRGSFLINATFKHDGNRISCFVINLDITK